MPKVSITEAAKLAGITRQYLYKKYINPGTISVETDDAGGKKIDTSEIFRVFGGLKGDSKQETQSLHEMTPENDNKTAALQTEIKLLREQLTAAQDDKKWLQGKVDQLTEQLTSTTRLLEHKEATTAEKESQIKQQQGQLNVYRKESLWRRLLGKKGPEVLDTKGE